MGKGKFCWEREENGKNRGVSFVKDVVCVVKIGWRK